MLRTVVSSALVGIVATTQILCAQALPLPRRFLTTCDRPLFAAAGDFNADGKPDVTFGGRGGIHLMLGNGDGSMQACRTLGAFTVTSVSAVDFDSDGTLDIITAATNLDGAAQHINGLTVLRGNGDGTFAPPEIVHLDGFAHAFMAGDLNGDGHIDLVVQVQAEAPPYQRLVTILNTPSGFVMASSIPFDEVSVLEVTDADRDGKVDILGLGKTHYLIARGDGRGSFTLFADGFHAYGYAQLGDLNGDGVADIVDVNDDRLVVDLGAGKSFATNAYPLGVSGIPILGDIDGDGRDDIIVVGDIVSVFRNKGDGTVEPQRAYYAGDGGPTAIADFNMDGRADLLFFSGSKAGATFTIIPGKGGEIDLPVAYIVSDVSTHVGNSVASVFADDVNRDGNADLVVLSQVGRLHTFLGNGRGSFALFASSPAAPVRSNVSEAFVADLDADGSRDYVLRELDRVPGTAAALFGRGDGSFEPVTLDLPSGGISAVGDFSPNSGSEMLIFSPNVLTVATLDRMRRVIPLAHTPFFGDFGGAAYDMNADGFDDLLAFTRQAAHVMLNDRVGHFTDSGAIEKLADASPLGFMDMDGDRRLDAVSTHAVGSEPALLSTRTALGGSFGYPHWTGIDESVRWQRGSLLGLKSTLVPRHDGTFDRFGEIRNGIVGLEGDLNADGFRDLVVIVQNAIAPLMGRNAGMLPSSIDVKAPPDSDLSYGIAARPSVSITSNYGLPSGVITFREENRTLASMLTESRNAAALPLTAGPHTIDAIYSGDAYFAPQSTRFSCNVTRVTLLPAVTAHGNVSGMPVSLDISLALDPHGTGFEVPRFDYAEPSGMLSVFDGTRQLLEAQASRRSTFSLTLPRGTHELSVVYGGDANHEPSRSKRLFFRLIDYPFSAEKSTLTSRKLGPSSNDGLSEHEVTLQFVGSDGKPLPFLVLSQPTPNVEFEASGPGEVTSITADPDGGRFVARVSARWPTTVYAHISGTTIGPVVLGDPPLRRRATLAGP